MAAYYLDAIEEYGGCPVDLVTDLGTENGIMAAIQVVMLSHMLLKVIMTVITRSTSRCLWTLWT